MDQGFLGFGVDRGRWNLDGGYGFVESVGVWDALTAGQQEMADVAVVVCPSRPGDSLAVALGYQSQSHPEALKLYL